MATAIAAEMVTAAVVGMATAIVAAIDLSHQDIGEKL